MLNDFWIIAQLMVHLFSFLLLTWAVYFSFQIVFAWNPNSDSVLQLQLERRSYLVSSILQFLLFFQICTLLLFLITVNNHLPHLLKGAMCATGVLGVNGYGYPLLYLKLGGVFLYSFFLIINYFDQSEPTYPLSPLKYYFVFPVFLLMLLDTYWTFCYYASIEPDIIATCCSVDFNPNQRNSYTLFDSNSDIFIFRNLFISIGGGLLGMAILKVVGIKKAIGSGKLFLWFQFLGSIVFVGLAVFTLKNFFAKYIYGLPSHQCLFDLFWAKYYFTGYLLFLSYFALLISALFFVLYSLFKGRMEYSQEKNIQFFNRIYCFAMLLAYLLPIYYWLSWKGDL